jgi:leader peptidase (prepilin peptidase)/N-methyltransferase
MVLPFLLIFVFVVGAAVGSFLNVAIARLPLEKSLLWPSSRCGACHQSIRWHDNLPLISYIWLRGRCRACGQHYSMVYFIVELSTALGFVGLFWLEVVENVHNWPNPLGPHAPRLGHFPWQSWLGFGWHALLFSFLMVASVCDLKSREIPLQLTLTGTSIGVIGSALMPWPFPSAAPGPMPPMLPVPQGIYPWPFWLPLPAWCDEGEWTAGLATGVIGALVGTFLLRTVGFLFSTGLGKEALGLGDADLMMMAGSFLGWQVVVVAFFLSVFPALVFGIILLAVKQDNSLPFGPSLSLSVMATCLAWQPIGAALQPFLFHPQFVILAIIAIPTVLFVLSLMMRLLRGKEEETPGEEPKS